MTQKETTTEYRAGGSLSVSRKWQGILQNLKSAADSFYKLPFITQKKPSMAPEERVSMILIQLHCKRTRHLAVSHGWFTWGQQHPCLTILCRCSPVIPRLLSLTWDSAAVFCSVEKCKEDVMEDWAWSQLHLGRKERGLWSAFTVWPNNSHVFSTQCFDQPISVVKSC